MEVFAEENNNVRVIQANRPNRPVGALSRRFQGVFRAFQTFQGLFRPSELIYIVAATARFKE